MNPGKWRIDCLDYTDLVYPARMGFYFQPIVFALLVVLLAPMGGVFAYSGVLIALLLHPILDELLGDFPENRETFGGEGTIALILLVPLEVGSLLWLGHLFLASGSTAEKLGFLLSGGVIGGIGITAAHELVHRQTQWLRSFGLVLLHCVGYPNYAVAHVQWHHIYVATPLDGASARFGEWVYAFWIRALSSIFKDTWNIEVERARNAKRFPWDFRNRFLFHTFLQVVVLSSIYVLWGMSGLVFFIGESLIAIALLESIDYIEHYGLVRQVLPNGKYEKVADKHSWDSYRRITNGILFKVGFHSMHHKKPSLAYPHLTETEAPRLPAGYTAMLLLALCPPLWRRVMDPLVRKNSQ